MTIEGKVMMETDSTVQSGEGGRRHRCIGWHGGGRAEVVRKGG